MLTVATWASAQDMLKWRLDSAQRHVEEAAVAPIKTAGDGSHTRHANHDMEFDNLFDPDE